MSFIRGRGISIGIARGRRMIERHYCLISDLITLRAHQGSHKQRSYASVRRSGTGLWRITNSTMLTCSGTASVSRKESASYRPN